MRGITILALMAIAGSAQAQAIYKCRDANGGLVYQNAPCGASQTTAAVKHYTAARYDPGAAAQLRQTQAAMVQRQQSSYVASTQTYGATGDTSRSQQRVACAAAKSNRESVLAQVGLSRTYDLLRRLDDSVYEACKGL